METQNPIPNWIAINPYTKGGGTVFMFATLEEAIQFAFSKSEKFEVYPIEEGEPLILN